MRIIVKKHDGCEYYSHVAVPTTRQNWTLEEYSGHLDYLDSLMGDV